MSDTPLGDFSRGTLIELWRGVIMKDAFMARDTLPGDLHIGGVTSVQTSIVVSRDGEPCPSARTSRRVSEL